MRSASALRHLGLAALLLGTQLHPAHAEVLRISAPVKVSLATVDFEAPDAS